MGLVFILYADLWDHPVLVWLFLALFAAGLLLFQRTERTFIDTV